MAIKVKDLVHTFTTVGKDACCASFYVELIGKPLNGKANVCEDWYNECPYMFDNARVSSWWLDDKNTVHITAFNY